MWVQTPRHLHQRKPVCAHSLPSLLLHQVVMLCHKPCAGLLIWCCQNIPFSYIEPQRSHSAYFLCTIAITVKCDKYQNASPFLRGCITEERKEGQSWGFHQCKWGQGATPFSLLEGVFLSLTFLYGCTYYLSQPDNTSVSFDLFVSILHQSSQNCKTSFLNKYFLPS